MSSETGEFDFDDESSSHPDSKRDGESEEDSPAEQFVTRLDDDVYGNYQRLVEEFGEEWVHANIETRLDEATEQAVMQLRGNMESIKQAMEQQQE